MKKIVYGAAGVVTSDAIADAVMQYARALALGVKADLVEIPVRTESGGREYATMLLGPASQIISMPTEAEEGELNDKAVVEDLTAKTRKLGAPVPLPYTPNDFDDIDYSSH